MKSAITGVTPPRLGEATIMTVWPSLAIYPTARALGRLYDIHAGLGIFTVGNLFKLASIPVMLLLYLWRILPVVSRRYTLSNRRVIVQRGIFATAERWVLLDDFDAIEILVLPGQDFYCAGQLIFKHGDVETFRLAAVSRPESFRHACLNAHEAYVQVQRIVQQQAEQETVAV